jgi:hypothetical protein
MENNGLSKSDSLPMHMAYLPASNPDSGPSRRIYLS